ncbi:Oligopeptide transport ATP-binding protein OppF [subsurface metagenome]
MTDTLGRPIIKNESDHNILVKVEHICKYFPVKRGFLSARKVPVIKAVDDVSFDIRKGETLGLVGESGCGKSTLGRIILRIYDPTSGKVLFGNTDVTALEPEHLRQFRIKMQIIFQDSYTSLNPRHKVGDIIAEPLVIHTSMSTAERHTRTRELLELVGLKATYARHFPHEFSGGQRQRINIARALALYPDFIVCDEPISALDVSIQAQVVNLLQDLQKKLGLTYFLIAHDLSMVQHIASRIAVMYLGKIMELAPGDVLFEDPLHPYTQSLMSAIPIPSPKIERKRKRIVLKGEVPSPINPPAGCVFHTRCPIAGDICKEKLPDSLEVKKDHFVACHLAKRKEIVKIL